MVIQNYSIEREDGQSRWYRVEIDGSLYSMETQGIITLNKSGHITSINGNGCSTRDFENAVVSFDAYSAFNKGRETEALEALEELVCRS